MLFAKGFREIEAEVWTSMPDALRKPGAACAWGEANLARSVDCFLEGPDFDAEGNLYCVDIPFGRILKITPEGAWKVVSEYDGWPNGLKVQRNGTALVSDFRRGIVRIGLETGIATEVLTHLHSEGFRGLNDLTVERDGVIFFTDQGQSGLHDPAGRVFRWECRANGRLDVVLDRVPSPNGLALNAEGSALFVAVTRDNSIWRVPLQPGGGVAKVGRFISLTGGTGPDGIAFDSGGALWVAHLGMGCVWRFNRRGEAVLRVSTPGDWPTNLSIHPNGSVYITESQRGEILRVPHAVINS